MQRRSDFDAIANFRSNTFFKAALGIHLRPLSPMLPQRMSARAAAFSDCSIQIGSKADRMAAGQNIELALSTHQRRSRRESRRRSTGVVNARHSCLDV